MSNKKESKQMSQSKQNPPSQKKVVTAPAAETNGEGKTAKPKRAKVRLVSTTVPGLWVRAFVDVIEKHGIPLDPKGVAMVPGKPPVFGLSAEERSARKAAKEQEKARIASMSDEEKLAYAQKNRETRQAKIAARKAAEREQLIAQIKAEIAAGKA